MFNDREREALIQGLRNVNDHLLSPDEVKELTARIREQTIVEATFLIDHEGDWFLVVNNEAIASEYQDFTPWQTVARILFSLPTNLNIHIYKVDVGSALLDPGGGDFEVLKQKLKDDGSTLLDGRNRISLEDLTGQQHQVLSDIFKL